MLPCKLSFTLSDKFVDSYVHQVQDISYSYHLSPYTEKIIAYYCDRTRMAHLAKKISEELPQYLSVEKHVLLPLLYQDGFDKIFAKFCQLNIDMVGVVKRPSTDVMWKLHTCTI